jgi:hypothetical protein
MTKPVAAAILTAITTAAATLVVQFPQYAVWFTLAGVLAAGALKSPLFTPEAKDLL